MRHETRFEPDAFRTAPTLTPWEDHGGRDSYVVTLAIIMAMGGGAAATAAVLGRADLALGVAAVLLAAGLAFIVVRILARRRLAQANPDYSQAVLDASNQPVCVTSQDFRLLATNLAYRRLFRGQLTLPTELVERQPDGVARLLDLKQELDLDGRGEGRVHIADQHGKANYIMRGQSHGAVIVWTLEVARLERIYERFKTFFTPELDRLFDALGVGFLLSREEEGANGPLTILFASSATHKWLQPHENAMGSDGTEPIQLDQINDGWALRRGSHHVPVTRYQFPLNITDDAGAQGGDRLSLHIVRRVGFGDFNSGEGRWSNIVAGLLDDAPIGLAMIGPDLKFTHVNATFEGMTRGVGSSGQSCTSIIEVDYRDEFRRSVQAVLDGATDMPPIEALFLGRSDHVFRVHFGAREESGQIHAVLYVIDTTAQKSLERQFVQAQKMQAVGQLAGGVAHDFNNLLTAILGFCDLLLMRHTAGDQSFSDINQIKQNANRAANLVRQLLAFSRQQTMRPKVISITDVMAELSNLIRRLIGENIEFRLVHGRDPGLIKVDQGQLEQVIVNLCVNARDAMPDGGKLTVRTERVTRDDETVSAYAVMPAGDYVLIEVSDTGHGIAKEHLAKVFEPFFTTKDVGKGTGLGLSTVYGIIKQTGGFVFAESEVGEGATFRVYLPRHKADPAANKAAKTDEPMARDLTGRETILLVEDEDAVRLFAARALTSKGYKVLEAVGGKQGLEIIRDHPGTIDLLVSDVVMPNMDGPALVKEARALRPDMRVIFISGYAVDMLRENLDGEDVRFLPKPFSLKQLAETVRESFEQT